MGNTATCNQPSNNPGGNDPEPTPIQPAVADTTNTQKITDVLKHQQDPTAELKTEFKWFEIGSIVINFTLAVIGAIALCIYHGQLSVMQGTLTEMRDDSRLDQRAWVGVSGLQAIPDTIQNGKPLMFVLKLTNTGKTPARNLVGSVVVDPAKREGKPSFKYTDTVERRGLLMPNGNSFTTAIVEPRGTHAIDMPPMSAVIVDAVTNGNLILYIHGRSFYSDIFDQHHWITYCYAVMKGKGPIQFEACPNHNDTGDGDKIPNE
jgi:hypothetical protein